MEIRQRAAQCVDVHPERGKRHLIPPRSDALDRTLIGNSTIAAPSRARPSRAPSVAAIAVRSVLSLTPRPLTRARQTADGMEMETEGRSMTCPGDVEMSSECDDGVREGSAGDG